MALIPWRPFREIEEWFREEWPELLEWPERWFREFPKFPLMRSPRVDLYESNGDLVAEFELPGVDPKNIELEVRNDSIRVEAKAEEKKEEKGKGYYRKELKRGYFKRIIPLPVKVQEKKAEAVYKDGVLKVTIPKVLEKKKEKEKGVKIKIKTSGK